MAIKTRRDNNIYGTETVYVSESVFITTESMDKDHGTWN